MQQSVTHPFFFARNYRQLLFINHSLLVSNPALIHAAVPPETL